MSFESSQSLEGEYGALVGRVSREVAEGVKPLLAEMEANTDRLQGELRGARALIRRLQQERAAEFTPRAKAHIHDPDDPTPVLVFDLDGTLRQSAAYPMVDPPFPNLKAALDRFVVRGCCLHMATGGLYYGSEDLDLYFTRLQQIQGWVQQFGLPIDLLLPKVVADVYYDDRMVEVPRNPDWLALADVAEESLSKRFDLKDGQWYRKDRVKVGRIITDWPEPDDMPKDQPRGYSGAKIDIDYHRTLSNASSSLREDKPKPDSVAAVRELYDAGVTVQLSCAGWNPATHSRQDSQARLAGLRRWARENGIPFDRIVAKDHGDLYFDDKGIRAVNWAADMPTIRRRLAETQGSVQPTEDEYDTDITSTAYNEDVRKGAAAAGAPSPYAGGKDKGSPVETAAG